MTKYKTHFNVFLRLQNDFNKGISNKVFGDLSNHLFNKWLNCERNMLNFISILDNTNKNRLLEWAYNNYGS